RGSPLFRPAIPGNTYGQCWREDETHRTLGPHMSNRGTQPSRPRGHPRGKGPPHHAAFRRRAGGGGRTVAVAAKQRSARTTMARSRGKTCGSTDGRKRTGGHSGSLNRRHVTRLGMGEILARSGAGQSTPVG